MALIKCEECGKEISSQAKTCPNCGAKTEISEKKKYNIILVVCGLVVIILVLLSIYFIHTSNPIYKYKQEAISILEEYKDNKNLISIDSLSQQIEDLQTEFDRQYKDNDDLSYSIFSNGLGLISNGISIDGIHSSTISNAKIDEYIKQLQMYR